MSNLHHFNYHINRKKREEKNGHKACVLWLTGLSGSGKSTLANELAQLLFKMNKSVSILDGDHIRTGLNKDLQFCLNDRKENIRRISEVAKLFADNGNIVICSFVSPTNQIRKIAREIIGDDYFECFIDADINECIKRDPKGLYKKAQNFEIKNFTGISATYEIPANADLVINTTQKTVKPCVNILITFLKEKNIIS